MDMILYALLNKKVKGLASGVKSHQVNGLDLIITFNDGTSSIISFSQPKDGVSIDRLEFNETTNELLYYLTDGTSGSAGTIPVGEDGLSAYEVAKKNGFDGTEEEWLESLKGTGGKIDIIRVNGEVIAINPTDKSVDITIPEAPVQSISVNDEEVEPDEDGNVNITIPDAYDDTALSNRVKTIEDNYAKTSDIPSLSGYATETWVNEQGFLTQHQDLSDYATKDEIPNLDDYAKTSDIPSLDGYATEAYVTEQISNIPSVDLTDYAKKSEIPDVSGYITEEQLLAKDYADKAYVEAVNVQSDWYETDENSGAYIKNKPYIDSINLVSCGCVGDGVTDDTECFKTALQRAITSGQTLYINKGTFLIKERIIIDKPVNIEGASQDESIILFQGEYHEETKYDQEWYEESNACFVIVSDNCRLFNFTITGGIDKDNCSQSNGIVLHYTKPNGTQYDAAQRVELTNLDIKYFKTGLFLYAGWNRYITRCHFMDNAEYGVKYYPLEEDTVGKWSASGDVYIACQFVGNLIAGFYANSLFESTIWNSVFEYNERAIVAIDCQNICFKNCWNEANYDQIYVKGSAKFEGGYNINKSTVLHEISGGNDLVQFESDTLITMCREGREIFNQTSGVIIKGVEIGVNLENLVRNPYFVEASGGTTLAPSTDGWYYEGTFELFEDNPNYIKISQYDATTDVYRGIWASDITISPGEKFNVSAWLKTDVRAENDSTGLLWYIAWKDAGGETILIDNRPITMIGDNNWELKEVSLTAPGDATVLIIGWGITRNGTLYLKEPSVCSDDGLTHANVISRVEGEKVNFYNVNGTLVGDVNLGVTATTEEVNYLVGAKENIQEQLDNISDQTVEAQAKLEGIEEGANKYILPEASSTLGGVKTTSTVTSNDGYTACPIISGVPYYKEGSSSVETTSKQVWYATCNTTSDVDIKKITLDDYTDNIGNIIIVKFNNSVSTTINGISNTTIWLRINDDINTTYSIANFPSFGIPAYTSMILMRQYTTNLANYYDILGYEYGKYPTINYDLSRDYVQLFNRKNQTWTDWKRGGLDFQYLIENGVVNTEFCGDLLYESEVYSDLSMVTATSRITEATEITQNGNELVIYASKASSTGVWGVPYVFGNSIDLTDYKYLKATFSISTNYTGTAEHQSSLVIRDSSSSIVPYTPVAHYALLDFVSMGASNTGTAMIDISALSGSYDIVLDLAFRPTSNTTTLTFEVTNMWLE